MGASVFLAPVLKVGSLAGLAFFPRQGWPYPARLEIPHPEPWRQHRQGGAVHCVGMDCTKGLSPVPQEGWHTRHCSPMSSVHPPHVYQGPCAPQTHPTTTSPHCHVDDLAAVGFHLLPLPCQEKPLQWPWITCDQTGSLFSLASFLTSEAGPIQPLIWRPPSILTSKLDLMEELLDGSGIGWMVMSRDLQSVAHVQMETSNRCCLPSVSTGQILFNIFIQDIDSRREHICRWHQAEVTHLGDEMPSKGTMEGSWAHVNLR